MEGDSKKRRPENCCGLGSEGAPKEEGSADKEEGMIKKHLQDGKAQVSEFRVGNPHGLPSGNRFLK